jgi:hypothetical protein
MRTHNPLNKPAAISFSILLLAALIQTASAQVTIEIVNDSGKPDTNVFIKVPGRLWANILTAPITPTNLFVNISDTNVTAAEATSLSLSWLAANGSAPAYTEISTISGHTNTVYSFQADAVSSGSIYFTYNQTYTFTNGLQPSPPPDSAGNAYRYDYAELSINDSNAPFNAVDVTYVDKFGIPLQMEWYRGSSPVAGSYVYASTKTLVERFSDNGLGQAVFSLNATNIMPGWSYSGPDAYTNFARILAPQKVSGTSTSVAPYPSITNYLNSLVGAPNAFWLNGASAQGGFYYIGYQASIATMPDGWRVTLSQASNPPPFNTALITGVQYTNTITFAISDVNASQYIYGAPVGPKYYSVNGALVTDATSGTYPVETWMIGDVLSALNFGFWGGRYGTNSADWFSPVEWTAFPFGSARQATDGFYNPYAALIYNNADPYSFAFSERITPDVLMAPGNGDRIRITILPDDRLDSPVVPVPAAGNITANSVTLNWGQVAGATGYQINVLRPLNVSPVVVSANATGYTLTNLLSGTPYLMSVQALGLGAGGNPIITPARPVLATTLGTNAVAGGNFAQAQVTFSVADPYFQIGRVFINGTELVSTNNQWLTTNNVPARWLASVGTNQVVVTVVGGDDQVLFNDWLTFVLAPPFTVTNGIVTTNSRISDVLLYGQKLSQPTPGVSGFLGGTTATNFLVSTLNPCFSIGLSYVPAETRRYAPAGSSTPVVTILDVQPLPGGGVQFTFDVSAGMPYTVEVSENLVTWQTRSSGTGQAGGETCSDPGTTSSGTRFYRIKL